VYCRLTFVCSHDNNMEMLTDIDLTKVPLSAVSSAASPSCPTLIDDLKESEYAKTQTNRAQVNQRDSKDENHSRISNTSG
jgi:hypothetical protein